MRPRMQPAGRLSRLCRSSCHQEGSCQERLVLTLDRVDRRGSPSGLRLVEDVVVNQRAHLDQLDGDSRCDNAGIEHAADVRHSNGQGGTKALPATTHHPEARSRQVGCADGAARRERPPTVSRCSDRSDGSRRSSGEVRTSERYRNDSEPLARR